MRHRTDRPDHLPTKDGSLKHVGATACSGHGFKHSAGIGEAMAKDLCGEAAEPWPESFRLARFSQAMA